ncbi:MAG TPA: glycosyltransferase family 4 protein [Chloroflexota bacterium]|nr:glycosyltransferase family 4 protein [Chloroflexota bacterium]
MKVGIYNRWLHTMGGGERYTVIAAQALAAENQVELITHRPTSLQALESKLHVDLKGITVRCIPDLPFHRLGDYTEEYDLFINASFMSFVPSRAKKSVLFVYFPFPVDKTAFGLFKRKVGLSLRHELIVPEYGEGFYGLQQVGGGWYRWTAEKALVHLPVVRQGAPMRVRMMVGSFRPGGTAPVPLKVSVQGRQLAEISLSPTDGNYLPLEVTIPGEAAIGEKVTLVLETETFNPQGGPGFEDDFRDLGVAVAKVKVMGVRNQIYDLLFERLVKEAGLRLAGIPDNLSLRYVDSYDLITPISEYVQKWLNIYWGKKGEILYPPVDVDVYDPTRPKRNVILNVGRFFSGSHNKKHMVMIDAFKRLCRRGLSGWELHLVGGAAPGKIHAEYLEKVRKNAQGYPIYIHADAPFSELQDLYEEASIYWHASGFGENENRNPIRFEHFGITTVEAMAAGAVPVVIAKAGQLEIVEQGKSGFLWNSMEELEKYTLQVATDSALRATLQQGAIARSRAFDQDSFKRRLLELIARI